MPYSLDGKSGSLDPNVDKNEPVDPDDIDPPERSHVRAHVIVSTARVNPSGHTVQGIDDYTCAGCHQGSNRTVLQYWGIRLDQNQDLTHDAVLNLDRIVREDGTPTGSNSHPTTDQVLGASNRGGALQAGPLSGALIQRLTNPNPNIGIVLDAWLDADGELGGKAADVLGGP